MWLPLSPAPLPSSAHAELRPDAEESHRMAMPKLHPAPGEWTLEDFQALPEDGKRYEIIDGVLYVTPSPGYAHQDALLALAFRLRPYLEAVGVGWVRVAPSDVIFTRRTVVEPDLYVAPLVGGRRPRTVEGTRLLLAIEILSPGTASRDRGVKRRLYQDHADEYWIVDLEARHIERWRPGDAQPEVLTALMTWRPARAGEAFTLDLPAYFREVWDE
jgi:Uma2 family endonuclease